MCHDKQMFFGKCMGKSGYDLPFIYSWVGFGALWQWASKQPWWNKASWYGEPWELHRGKVNDCFLTTYGFSESSDALYLIDPVLFADTLYVYLTQVRKDIYVNNIS